MYYSQRNFNGGVISPWIDARDDLTRYRSSMRQCKNFICMASGGLRRRMGTEHVAVTTGKSRLLSFQLGSTEGYMLEFGVGYIRVYSGEKLAIADLVTPYSASEIFELQYVKINSVMFIAHRNHAPRRLRFISRLNWVFDSMDFDYPAFVEQTFDGRTIAVTPDGTNISTVTVAHTYTTDLAAIKTSGLVPVSGAWRVTVSSLVFSLITPQYLKLQRSSDGGTDWVDLQTFTAVGSYAGTSSGLLRLTSVECTVNAQLQADSTVQELSKGDTVNLTASLPFFRSGHVGSEIEVNHRPIETEQRLSLRGSGTSPWIIVQGTWRLFTSGTWRGRITIEKSSDNGLTTEIVLNRSGQADRNIVYDAKEEEKVIMRIRFAATGAGSNDPHATLENDGAAISGRVRISSIISTTQATGVVVSGVYSTAPTDDWREGAWSNHRGWPAAIAWHESRIFFGGSKADPSTLWASRSDDFYNFREGSNDDNAFQRIIATSDMTNILWLASYDSLYIGTTGEEWRGTSDSDSGIITPASFILRRVSNTGSKPISPLLAGASIIHVQRQGRSLFQIGYDASSASQDGYAPTDLSQLAPHVTNGGIVSMAYQAVRDRIIWATTGDGRLIGLSYDRQQNVAGWHEHDTQGKFISVATVYENGSEDSVYLSVERNGVFSIERIKLDQYDILENKEMIGGLFSDGATIFRGASTTVITGLGIYNGKQVQVVANGIWKGLFLVTGGSLTLPQSTTYAVIGLPYESVMETLPITFDAGDGGSGGRFKRVSGIILRVYRSVGGQVACNARGAFKWENMRNSWRKWVDMDETPVAGDFGNLEDWQIPVASGHDRDARLAVRITEPFPLNILSVTANVDFSP